MIGRGTAEDKLAYLRELILNARAMPMSASCVINRSEVLAAIDDVIENLPQEIADAQRVVDTSASKVAEGEAEAGRILAEAREHAASLAQHSEVVRVAEQVAAETDLDWLRVLNDPSSYSTQTGLAHLLAQVEDDPSCCIV